MVNNKLILLGIAIFILIIGASYYLGYNNGNSNSKVVMENLQNNATTLREDNQALNISLQSCLSNLTNCQTNLSINYSSNEYLFFGKTIYLNNQQVQKLILLYSVSITLSLLIIIFFNFPIKLFKIKVKISTEAILLILLILLILMPLFYYLMFIR